MGTDRKGIAFYLPDSRISLDEVPDDYYELSQNEVKSLYKEFVQKRTNLDEKPMMTSHLRELEQKRKIKEFLDRYKYCVVRVQFADRTVLQGVFTPNEQFHQVTTFVRSQLNNAVSDFFLFTTPPKTIPDPNKTLLELNFVPGVKLYFGTPQTDISSFLKEETLANIRTPEIAAKEAHQFRMTKVIKEEEDKSSKEKENCDKKAKPCDCSSGEINEKSTNLNTSPGPSRVSARPKTSPDKVPKWFQPNKK